MSSKLEPFFADRFLAYTHRGKYTFNFFQILFHADVLQRCIAKK